MSPILRNQRGAVLLHVLMFTTLVTAVAAGVALLAKMETLVTAHFRQRRELAAGAVAVAEIALQDLRRASDWSQVLAGTQRAAFTSGAVSSPLWVDGARTICCGAASLTGQLNVESGTSWTPYGWTTLADLTGTPASGLIHVIVWVADDEADGDGDPARDANGVIRMHAQAVAPSGGRRMLSVTVARTAGPPPYLSVLLWRPL
jgi:Tfp pilus assembly protein PilX